MTDISVNSLGLSGRATNALNRIEIHTLEQLLNTSIEEIEKERNIGARTVQEIQEFVQKCVNGNIDLNSLIDRVSDSTQDKKERRFSEEEIEEMSRYAITELKLSARAENTLLRIGCDTIGKLAIFPEDELRELKGLGKKSCDEVISELSNWIEKNLLSFNENDEEEIISDEERNFFIRLTEILFPIKQFYWKQLREVCNQKLSNSLVKSFDMETICDGLISEIVSLNEFYIPLKNFFLGLVPDGIARTEEFLEKMKDIDFQFNNDLIVKRLFDGKICSQDGEVCYLNKPNVTQYLSDNKTDFESRIYEMLMRRLHGESLQSIGEEYDVTRERVRQILVKTARKMPDVFEDYYRIPYEYFKFTKEEFCNAFPECGSIGYEFLFLKYKKGKILVGEESICGYTGLFRDKMSHYWREEALRRDKIHVTRTEMVYRVLLSNSDCAMSMEEFEVEYNNYLSRRNYPKERLSINIRTVSNHFRNAHNIVFDKENRVRYCEADPKVIWKSIDFSQYKDLIISAELIYKDYADLMDEQDIRDGYELFYVIKSSLENWDCSDFEISCRRVPVMVIGHGDEAKQALQLLKEISPIDFNGYYEAYGERFGVRSASGNPVITGALVHYYLDGKYSVDVTAIENEDAENLCKALSLKKFWFNDEVEKLFQEICIHSSEDAFNKAAFKRIGYSLNIGYLYNDDYGTVVNYFDQEIFTKDILDLNEYDHRLLMLSAFESALYKKRMDLEYIEVAPRVYMTVTELERRYGMSIGDIHELQKWINNYNRKYFNAHSAWEELKKAGLENKLQENEWLCTCIFRQQPTVFSQQVAGGIILCKNGTELNLGAVCQWIVETNGKMSVQNLTNTFNEIFATRISVSKIAEKLKSYGLWDDLVTDSFDDYIDHLVVTTGADIDVDDLLQEEFF
ncbi:MAG: DNA-directed RNA polymerase subunit alpha C-terminal domain-containing protein [Lachnospiraceae bacterium]|nr:DNA-directed RNA polymerase subunit alpha C-terminal domain-containing protein [Lachnospiraceae bacterium]